MSSPLCQLLVVGAVMAPLLGCSRFPCQAEPKAHELDVIEFAYDGPRVRYTYWLDDGAQRVVFDRENIPETARAAALVHIEGKTTGELHGALGWTADVRPTNAAVARLRPMARARVTAYAAWRGDWMTRWIHARSRAVVRDVDAQRAVSGALAADADLQPAASGPPKEDVPGLREKLEAEGISLGGVKMARALRSIEAGEPTPKDFGLSIDVHPAWLFVEEGCGASDEASAWLDETEIGHHVLRVGDPSNAASLETLSRRAGAEPSVPTVWRGDQLIAGFADETYEREFQ